VSIKLEPLSKDYWNDRRNEGLAAESVQKNAEAYTMIPNLV